MSNLLRSLRTNERRWANHSGCSCQKSDHEQITQVTHDKWVTVSDSLRSLMINEWMSKSLVFSNQIAHLLFRSQKTSDSLKKIWLKSYFCYIFCTVKKTSDLLISSFLTSNIQAIYFECLKWGTSGALVYHPIMLCFLQQERPVSLLSGSKNRNNLSCIEHILQNV